MNAPPNANKPNINSVNNNGVTAIAHADEVINKFSTLRDSLNEKINNINLLINSIPPVKNNSVTNNIDATKIRIAEYFTELLDKKGAIDNAIIDLQSQTEIINNFIKEKDNVVKELSDAAKKITTKRDAINASIDNNNKKNADLSAKMDSIQSKKSRVIDLSRGIKKLLLTVNIDSINKIKKTLNTKFIKLRYDLRNKIVTYYETLSGTNSGLLNAKAGEYSNNLSNTDKMSILVEINTMINKMLKYVDFCSQQISNNKLGNINVNALNNQASNENKNYNKTANLLAKIDVLKEKLTTYKTQLNDLKTRLNENFEKELKELTQKIIDATDELKKCIDIYIASLNFSGVNNQKKITKHNLQEIETNAASMKSQMNVMKTTLNTILSNQNTKSSAKLTDIMERLDAVLGSNTPELANNSSSVSTNATELANNSSSVSTNATEWFNSETPNLSDFEKNKIIKWNPKGNKIMKGKVETGNVVKGTNNKNRIRLVNVTNMNDNTKQSPVNFNLEKYKKGNNGVYIVK